MRSSEDSSSSAFRFLEEVGFKLDTKDAVNTGPRGECMKSILDREGERRGFWRW